MVRLDKYLAQLNYGSRSQVKEMLKKGQVTVNGGVEKRAERKVDEETDRICVLGEERVYKKHAYYMLNKPAGVVSATKDRERTVLDLLDEEHRKGLFPVGRLDKDTVGLMLLTDDGVLAHRLLSPKRHVEKTYLVQLDRDLTPEEIKILETGADIGEERLTLPAKVQVCGQRRIYLTITEGRFHQVKRMISAVGAGVLYLKRIRMGALKLDESLKEGEYRELTEEEYSRL